ncbi:hypothetical protein RB199_04175 [Streptomyces libani]
MVASGAVASGDAERAGVGESGPLGAGADAPPVGRLAPGEAVSRPGAVARVRVSSEKASVPISTAVAATAAPAVSSTAGSRRLRRREAGERPAGCSVGRSSSDAWNVREAGLGRRRIPGARGSAGRVAGGAGARGGPVAVDGPSASGGPVAVDGPSARCTAASTPGKSSRSPRPVPVPLAPP